jgi:hypothetical protein
MKLTAVALGVAGLLLVPMMMPGMAAAAPLNDAFASAITAPALPYSNVQDTTLATLEVGEPFPAEECAPATLGNTVWYSFTAPVNGTYQVDTLGSNFDTIVSVFTGSALNALTSIACSDDVPSKTQSRVQFTGTAGVTYRVQVGGFDFAGGLALTNILLVPPPPANDNFASAQNIATAPFTDKRQTHAATTEGAETHPCNAQGKTVWYRFVSPNTGQYQIDTLGSDYDTILSVFSGTELNALTSVVCNDDVSIANRSSRVTLNALVGTTYYIKVGGFAPDVPDTDFGNLTLNFKGSSADSDGDGCTDAQESDLNPPQEGGGRNRDNFWDFFDVTGDKAIDVADVVLILNHFGHGPNTDAMDNLLDRWAPDPSASYLTAEAVGQHVGVDVSDALVSLQSFGHSCA